VNLLEPWVLLRVVAGLVTTLFFARAAMTAQKVLRNFDVRRATEGQLALEKQIELASTFVRVGSIMQVLALALTVLGADRLSRGVRGAMCAYGVFGANEWGFRSLAVTGAVACAAGVLGQIYAFDGRVRTLDLARPLAALTLITFPLTVIDLVLVAKFFGALDLSVVASCCSVRLDPIASAGEVFTSGPRRLATLLAVIGVALSIGVALFAARSPTKVRLAAFGAVSLLSLPAALAASVLEVAPHVFEVPHHVCPFCLLRSDAYAIGYPLFGALFLAVVWAVGAAASAVLSRSAAARDALAAFARPRVLGSAVAWALALALGVLPVARYAIISGGASLFR